MPRPRRSGGRFHLRAGRIPGIAGGAGTGPSTDGLRLKPLHPEMIGLAAVSAALAASLALDAFTAVLAAAAGACLLAVSLGSPFRSAALALSMIILFSDFELEAATIGIGHQTSGLGTTQPASFTVPASPEPVKERLTAHRNEACHRLRRLKTCKTMNSSPRGSRAKEPRQRPCPSRAKPSSRFVHRSAPSTLLPRASRAPKARDGGWFTRV